jgi:hypothetical protein
MAKTKIGYENKLEASTSIITVTDQATGFEKELAYNWRTFDGWKANTVGTVYYNVDLGSAQSVDYWGCAAHTLGTNGGSIKLQYSATGAYAGEEVDFAAAVSPSNDKAMFQTVVTPISARYWRWEITSTPVSFFGVLSLGLSLEMPRAVRTGFALPRQSRENKIINQRAEGGAFLGRSVVRKGFGTRFKDGTLLLSFARGDWDTFLDHAELKPFFFSWNPDYDDAVYAWMDGDPDDVKFDRHNTVAVGMRIKGLL